MKKGFTLIELLGVIVIIALISLIIFPTIMNNINASRGSIDSLTESLIKTATELYVQENAYIYNLYEGERYCITLEDLVKANLLTAPILNSNQEEIKLYTFVQTDITSDKTIYTIVDDCEPIYVEILEEDLETE